MAAALCCSRCRSCCKRLFWKRPESQQIYVVRELLADLAAGVAVVLGSVFAGFGQGQDLRAEEVVALEIFGGNLITPVSIHVQGCVSDEQALEVQLSSFDQSLQVFQQQVSQSGNVDACVRLP